MSCCSVNGNGTDWAGSCSDWIVCATISSYDLLKEGSSGRVEMDLKCCAMILRLSIGVRDGGAVGSSDVNAGRGWKAGRYAMRSI